MIHFRSGWIVRENCINRKGTWVVFRQMKSYRQNIAVTEETSCVAVIAICGKTVFIALKYFTKMPSIRQTVSQNYSQILLQLMYLL